MLSNECFKFEKKKKTKYNLSKIKNNFTLEESVDPL
jgi:hypothetical protein